MYFWIKFFIFRTRLLCLRRCCQYNYAKMVFLHYFESFPSTFKMIFVIMFFSLVCFFSKEYRLSLDWHHPKNLNLAFSYKSVIICNALSWIFILSLLLTMLASHTWVKDKTGYSSRLSQFRMNRIHNRQLFPLKIKMLFSWLFCNKVFLVNFRKDHNIQSILGIYPAKIKYLFHKSSLASVLLYMYILCKDYLNKGIY